MPCTSTPLAAGNGAHRRPAALHPAPVLSIQPLWLEGTQCWCLAAATRRWGGVGTCDACKRGRVGLVLLYTTPMPPSPAVNTFAQGQFFNDTYILDTATFTWHRPLLLNAAPAPRYHHSCVVVGGRTIIYGGINSKQTFDGIVLVDSKGDNDISQIAEELSTMMASNATAPGMRAPSIDHAYSPVAPGSSRSIQTATAGLPVREPSVHGVATGAGSMSGGAGVMDLMKAQLTDLLVKRNLEELQLQAQRKAEVGSH